MEFAETRSPPPTPKDMRRIELELIGTFSFFALCFFFRRLVLFRFAKQVERLNRKSKLRQVFSRAQLNVSPTSSFLLALASATHPNGPAVTFSRPTNILAHRKTNELDVRTWPPVIVLSKLAALLAAAPFLLSWFELNVANSKSRREES